MTREQIFTLPPPQKKPKNKTKQQQRNKKEQHQYMNLMKSQEITCIDNFPLYCDLIQTTVVSSISFNIQLF